MSYFQNLFDEYDGVWSLGGEGRGIALTFKVPGNRNRGEAFVAWNTEPYDLSGGGGVLTFNFAFDPGFRNIASLAVAVAGSDPANTLAWEVRDALNASPEFSAWFTAGADVPARGSTAQRVYVRQKKPVAGFRTHVSNSGAELKLKFNKFGGVADIPSYFDKDSIANRYLFPEANNQLIRLGRPVRGNTAASPSVVTSAGHGLTSGASVYFVGSNSTPTLNGLRVVTVTGPDTFTVPVAVTTAGTSGEWLTPAEYGIVTDAGLDPGQFKADWQHLRGRTSTFGFTRQTLDGSNRVVAKVVYPAGAAAGQMAKKTLYTYSGAGTTPVTEAEVPYVLTQDDLVTPS